MMVGDTRLELKSTNKAFARDLMTSEVMSLYGVTSPEDVAAVSELRLSAVSLGEAFALDSPPLFNRVVALRIYQHLVPMVQESAKRAIFGCATSTRGGVTPTSEPCRIHAADTDSLDIVLLDEHLSFTHGNRTLQVPEGTSVQVMMDHEPRKRMSDDGIGCDGERSQFDASF